MNTLVVLFGLLACAVAVTNNFSNFFFFFFILLEDMAVSSAHLYICYCAAPVAYVFSFFFLFYLLLLLPTAVIAWEIYGSRDEDGYSVLSISFASMQSCVLPLDIVGLCSAQLKPLEATYSVQLFLYRGDVYDTYI